MSYPASQMHARVPGGQGGIRFHDQHANVGGGNFRRSDPFFGHDRLPRAVYTPGIYVRNRHSDGDCLRGLIECIQCIVCVDLFSKLCACSADSGNGLLGIACIGVAAYGFLYNPAIAIVGLAALALVTCASAATNK